MVLAAGLYEDEYFEPLRDITLIIAAGLALSGFLFFFLSRVMGRALIGKPVERLGKAFAAADGGHDGDFPTEWEDEFGQIARAADRMLNAIQEREAMVRQAQKREVAATIASGMAHDMNNMLGGIVGSVSLLKAEAEDGPSVASETLMSSLAFIQKSANTAAGLVKKLLDFSKADEQCFRPIDIRDAVDEALSMARRVSPPEVLYLWNPGGEGAMTLGDSVRLVQVFLNVLINALDAVTLMRGDGASQGGTIAIELKEGELKRGGRSWNVSIRDDGVGMDEEARAHAFDAFYSVGKGGKGTGLGLAMVRHIIKQHGGEVELLSSPGAGTEIGLFLPAVAGNDN